MGEAVATAPVGSMLTPGILTNFEHARDTLLSAGNARVLARSSAEVDRSKTQAAPLVAETTAKAFLAESAMREEVFGPFGLLVTAESEEELRLIARSLDGQLTATIHGTPADLVAATDLLSILACAAGRVIVNGFPTGVEVCHAMQHGGPWPATSDARFTSVGTAALERFVRPVCYQDVPDQLLPPALQDANPLGISRLVDGIRT
jgi:NADP-dependent aldehyde dehydrogenase